MVKTTIQSNSMRGEMMRDIIDRTFNEIHDTMQTVFGPYATDAYIIKDGHAYYTRDGKEVFQSLMMDNPISTCINRILYQATADQARKVGDGTTTLLVLYSNLYKSLSKVMKSYEIAGNEERAYSMTDMRKSFNKITKMIIDYLKRESTPITDDLLKSMIYTCTQDAELASKIYSLLSTEMLKDSYIMVNKSNIETDLQVDVHTQPIIKTTKLYDSRPSAPNMIENAAVFFVNGHLDISDIATLETMGRIGFKGDIHPAIVFLCSGVTEATRRVLKNYDTLASTPNIKPYNRVCIFSLSNFRSYDSEQIDDLVAYVYDRPETSGLDTSITFEANLYHTFMPAEHMENQSLSTFAPDPENIASLKQAMCTIQTIEYSPSDGLKFNKPLGDISQKRYNTLRKMIEEEKSPVKKIDLNNRLRKLYGQFIEVSVGSKLLKDSQRKFELVLDAITSASDAVKYGAVPVNSIYLTLSIIKFIKSNLMQTLDYQDRQFMNAFQEAFTNTLVDMIQNKYPSMKTDTIISHINGSLGDNDTAATMRFDLTRPFQDIFNRELDPEKIQVGDVEINTAVVEPVTVMTNLLENSMMILEFAGAKMFNMDSFMNNFLP